MPRRTVTPCSLPVLGVLDDAVAAAGGVTRPLVKLLAAVQDRLPWGQTYTQADFGARFLENYGWTEIFGTRGHFVNESVAGGFLVLGPDTHYPHHHHEAEEIYVPLTGGSVWSLGDGPETARTAGEVIHHPSRVAHAMRTGEAPLVALYLWRGGPLAERSTIGTARP
jgi:hypothetical protein